MIRLRVPGTLEYRDLSVRVVAAACKLVSGAAVPKLSRSASPTRSAAANPDVAPVAAAADEFDTEVISAFGEAFNNLCIHAYGSLRSGDVELEIQTSDDEIVIRMMDTAPSFDPMSVAPPSLRAPRENGMGIFIMRSFMDVTYEAGAPNVLCLRKRRTVGRQTNVQDEPGAKAR